MKSNHSILKRFFSLFVFIIAATLSSAFSQELELPDMQGVVEPTTNYPSGFMSFNPPVDLTYIPSADAPQIAEWIRAGDAGDTILLTGHNLSSFTESQYSETIVADYAEFHGTDYLRVGEQTDDTVVEIAGRFTNPTPPGPQVIFGSSGENGIRHDKGYIKAGGLNSKVNLLAYDTNDHVYVWNNNNFEASVDGAAPIALAGSKGGGATFYWCSGGGVWAPAEFKLRYFKVWQGGNLVIDAKPHPDGYFLNAIDGLKINNRAEKNSERYPLDMGLTRTFINDGEAGSDTRYFAFGQNDKTSTNLFANIHKLNGDQAAVELPGSLPPGEMYMLWAGNSAGFGEPIYLNQTDAWWVGFDKVSVGDTFSVYGRNLDLGDGLCQLYIDGHGWILPTAINPYKVDFVCPALARGTHEIYIHNGHGKKYGWSSPLTLTVEAPYIWTENVFNVMDYYEGGGDYLPAIKAAYSDSVDGDTIYFPAGTYGISANISPYDQRRWVGAGIDKTIIRRLPGTRDTGYIVMNEVVSRVTFEDLTLASTISGGGSSSLVSMTKGKNITFNRVKFDTSIGGHSGSVLAKLDKTSYLTIKDCETVQAGSVCFFNINLANQVLFDGCDLVGADGNTILIGSWGGRQVSIVNCTAKPLDDTTAFGRSEGRWFVISDVWGMNQNIYFGGNASTKLGPVYDVGYHMNTGEQVLIEGGKVRDFGNAVSATSNTITMASLANVGPTSTLVTVVDGKGKGQTRQVIDIVGATASVDENWRVIPDTTSVMNFAFSARRMAVYDNSFNGQAAAAVPGAEHSASTAVELYGQCTDIIVDKNICTDLRAGLRNLPIDYSPIAPSSKRIISASFFNVFKNNIIRNCFYGIKSDIGLFHGNGPFEGGGIFATVYSGNIISEITEDAFGFSSIEDPQIDFVLIEKNEILDTPSLNGDSLGLRNQLWINNRMTGGEEGFGLDFSHDQFPVIRGNTWNGLKDNYIGTPLMGNLQIPQRTIDASSTNSSGTFVVWNSGSGTMHWVAESKADWLVLEPTNGILGVENGQAVIGWSIDSEILSNEEPPAVIEIRNGSQKQQMTVYYSTGLLFSSWEVTIPTPAFLGSCRATLRDLVTGEVRPLGRMSHEDLVIYNLIYGHTYEVVFEEDRELNGSWVHLIKRTFH